MKKCFHILFAMILISISAAAVYADHGLPSGPEYTVVINTQGTDYCLYDNHEYDSPDYSDGHYAGGSAFYVWADWYDNEYLGTTDARLSSDDYEKLVYIPKSSVMEPSTKISPESGVKNDSRTVAVTTDKLNLRCGPGTGFKVLEVLDKGVQVEYEYTFSTDTNWMYVTGKSNSGWVSGDYLRTVKEEKPDEDKVVSEAPQDNTGQATVVENEPGSSLSLKVIGIIMMCVGAAILIATIAVYILKNRQQKQ